MSGNGFFWYDTGQNHIITNSLFRNCGYRSAQYNQYDNSANRGCGDDAQTGCSSSSTVFGFLAHSDQFTPEVMQGTKNITFQNCGRRFFLSNFNGPSAPSTVSGRTQNWLDTDGSVSGLGVPALIGSGQVEAGLWWTVDNEGKVLSNAQSFCCCFSREISHTNIFSRQRPTRASEVHQADKTKRFRSFSHVFRLRPVQSSWRSPVWKRKSCSLQPFGVHETFREEILQ
jgi:hypothetical protein